MLGEITDIVLVRNLGSEQGRIGIDVIDLLHGFGIRPRFGGGYSEQGYSGKMQ